MGLRAGRIAPAVMGRLIAPTGRQCCPHRGEQRREAAL